MTEEDTFNKLKRKSMLELLRLRNDEPFPFKKSFPDFLIEHGWTVKEYNAYQKQWAANRLKS